MKKFLIKMWVGFIGVSALSLIVGSICGVFWFLFQPKYLDISGPIILVIILLLFMYTIGDEYIEKWPKFKKRYDEEHRNDY